MKRIVSSVLVTAVLLVLPMTLWAAEVSVVSDTDTKVFYNGLRENSSIKPTKGPAGWNSNPDFDDSSIGWYAASLYMNGAYLNPDESTSPFYITGAKWISYSGNGEGPDVNQADGRRGVYLYRQIFRFPGAAYIVSGNAAIASDNYGWLYVNGKKVLGPRDLSEAGRNFESPPSTGIVPSKLLACNNNVLAAEIQNGCGDCEPGVVSENDANGPTGTVFSLTLNYEVPNVDWRPPMTDSGFVRKNGSTLPLKFRFHTQNGKLIKEMQYVYLAVYEGEFTEPLGITVARWTLGNSVRHLRFSNGDGQYIANFQTQKMDLADGTYAAVVHDGCSEEVLGYIEFELVGKKKEKDPKPPKPKK